MPVKNRNILTKFLSSNDLALNIERRTVGFSFSSKSNICERYAYSEDLPEGASYVFDEQLSHDPEAWDLTTVKQGSCPFLRNHTRGQKLGIIKSVEIDGERGTAIAKLSQNTLADQYISDLQDGTAGGISFGYYVEEYRVISPAEYSQEKLIKKALLEATKIVLFEISSEDIPADPTVGYGKSAVGLSEVIIKGNPNFSPKNNMNEELINELTSVKSALTASETKQQILIAENDKLALQLKQLELAVAEKSQAIANLEKKELIAIKYYDLRQKAEDLVSEAKLSSTEFNELFSQLPSEDIAAYVKSEAKLGHIEFHLELIQKRAKPLLNLQQSTKDEPIENHEKTSSVDSQNRAHEILATLRNSPITI